MPDFPKANQDPGVDRFLRKYGLRYEEVPVGDLKPTGLHLALGTSPRGGQHAVIEKDGKLVHDPHPVSDDPRRGLVDTKAYGLLLPVKGEAIDAAPLKGKRLHTAAEKLYEKHDEIDWNLERREWMHNKGPEVAAYAATHQGIVALVNEATNLLGRAQLDDDLAYWQLKLQKAKEALKKSEQIARSGNYKQALAYQEGAFTLAHMVIDKMRNSGKVKTAKDALDKRARMHRALDCVMDRSFGK